ncbi:hypothetical protein F5Y09DRAFT_311222 [Xylaria sp. FL1042]|nr:hypothetical protein F5Y09DRAFT_311222 [Xylaria sp. FL1042]
MDSLGRALMALVLVVPTLAAPAPGPVMTWLSHQDPSKVTKQSGYTVTIVGEGASYSTTIPPGLLPPSPPFPLLPSPGATDVTTPTTELRKKSNDKCTPGDRVCHANLGEVLFCNENNDWVSYAQCEAGTFCHRLHMICVPEVIPPDVLDPEALASANSSQTLHLQSSKGNKDDNKCKEGDRRCDPSFHRVDRCNSEQTWVTYHDCRISERCDEDMFECFPREEPANYALPNAVSTLRSPPTNSV